MFACLCVYGWDAHLEKKRHIIGSFFSAAIYSHTHTHIYIYIYSHPQTDCFVLSELFSVARHAGRSKPGSKPVQLYVRLCFRPLSHQADHVGNFKVFLFLETAAAAFVYIFYTLLRVLNSFKELCITLAAADNSFARELNPHGGAYIVIHRQTVSFYQNSSVWLDTQDARRRDRNPSNYIYNLLFTQLVTYPSLSLSLSLAFSLSIYTYI